MLWQLLIHRLEQAVNLWKQLLCGVLESATHLLKSILSQLLCSLLSDQALPGEVFLQSANWAGELTKEILPFLHLLLVTVPLGEVTGGMVSHTVRDSLNQDRSLLLDDKLPSLLGSCIDGEEIVAINPDGWQRKEGHTARAWGWLVGIDDGCVAPPATAIAVIAPN